VVALTVFAVVTVWPSMPSRYLPGDFWPEGKGLKIGGFERETMRLGLDLRGGAYLVLEADPPADYDGDVAEALGGAKNVIERRVNALGVSEAEVQESSGNRIVVQIPGVTITEAQNQVGRTAALLFKVYDDNSQLVPAGVISSQTIAMTVSTSRTTRTRRPRERCGRRPRTGHRASCRADHRQPSLPESGRGPARLSTTRRSPGHGAIRHLGQRIITGRESFPP
jgi:hypothetical protein